MFTSRAWKARSEQHGLPLPQAKAPKAKAAKAAAPLGNSNAANLPAAGGKKAIEDIYQKKTQLEHILLRPDTYIGSTEKQQAQLWVHNGSEMVYKNVSYTPGLYKIFDEILVNAADNKVRDPTMDTLRVDINPVGGTSSTAAAACCQQ
jgi:DNA topoisomerase-2